MMLSNFQVSSTPQNSKLAHHQTAMQCLITLNSAETKDSNRPNDRLIQMTVKLTIKFIIQLDNQVSNLNKPLSHQPEQ